MIYRLRIPAMEGTTNLCTTPHADNVIRINVKKPKITVPEHIQ